MSKQNFTKPDILLAELDFRHAQSIYEHSVDLFKHFSNTYSIEKCLNDVNLTETFRLSMYNVDRAQTEFDTARIKYIKLMGLE